MAIAAPDLLDLLAIFQEIQFVVDNPLSNVGSIFK
jgi:hypothetical protein